MNSLTGADKRWLERTFEMSGGFVLDFNNPSFERFFDDYDIDIYDARYEIYGRSKANRLRAFWDIESDALVRPILHALLESSGFLERESVEFSKSRAIVDKLSGKSLKENNLDKLKVRRQEMKMDEEKHLEQLWGPGAIRVFISHVSQCKNDAMTTKDALEALGIASFVAHNDIEPTKEWQTEIVRALSSMGLFIALLTKGFKESDWTDQEVGFALATEVPILPVHRGKVPYGFIGKYQAFKWSGPSASSVATETFKTALNSDELNSDAKDAFIAAVSGAKSTAQAKELSLILPHIKSLTPQHAEGLLNAYNSNRQVIQEGGFQRSISSEFNRMTENKFAIDGNGQLFRISEIEGIPF